MTSVSIRVDTHDQVGEARRRAATLASWLRLDETAAGRLAIIVTECANNLWRHAGGGEILLSPIDPEEPGVDVLALDKGPGMVDVARCFQDGYSTAGSAGTGLGAICRLSTLCDVYSIPGKGTALLSRVKGSAPRRARAQAIEVRGVAVAMRGEAVCGDDFAYRAGAGWGTVLVVDGLGHGPDAAASAKAAVDAFHGAEMNAPAELMREIHGALRSTRGAAVAIAHVDYARGELRYAGIGNIAGQLWGEAKPKHLLSHPGIVGSELRNVREITYELGSKVLALLYSDGITTHWSLDAYDGLLSRDPSLIAGVVYRDHSRGRDDATVVVVRERSTGQ